MDTRGLAEIVTSKEIMIKSGAKGVMGTNNLKTVFVKHVPTYKFRVLGGSMGLAEILRYVVIKAAFYVQMCESSSMSFTRSEAYFRQALVTVLFALENIF